MTYLVGGEIFELNKEVGECTRHLEHELLHKLVHFFHRYSWLTETEVERVLQEFLVVGAQVKAYWDSGTRSDTEEQDRMSDRVGNEMTTNSPSASNVEGKLANGNGHAIHAQITQAKDT